MMMRGRCQMGWIYIVVMMTTSRQKVFFLHIPPAIQREHYLVLCQNISITILYILLLFLSFL